ncbi:unnamed protein product [Pleuronectes platessa]|uniref:Uncharacterized protein n=1 Tax=Pleuronectes platessa TaxID=8262 RepID=A0A9N7TVW0_PLEPL|nr:unnamed protein product [Pleuronectes platessa]
MQSDDAAQHKGYSVNKALHRAYLDTRRKNQEIALKEEASEKAKLRSQAAEQSFLAEDNIGLREQEKSALTAENTALAAENTALEQQAAQKAALAAENTILKKLTAKNAVIQKHEAEIADLKMQAAESTALAAVNVALKRQLTAEYKKLQEHTISTTLQLVRAREDCVDMMMFVNTARAREEEFEKELKVMKTTMKEKVEENISLTTDLHLQHLENQKVQNDWKVKFAALQENYEEKLRCSVLEEEASFQQREFLENKLRKTEKWFFNEAKEAQSLLLKNIQHQNLTFETDNVKVKNEKEEKKEQLEREKKEKEKEEGGSKGRSKWSSWFLKRDKEKKETNKQEKKVQMEREKKEKQESKELKKREKKEKEKEERRSKGRSKWFPCFLL